MPSIWLKICANTSLEDARPAADLGADAVGFVFAASPRQVTARQVAAIVPGLPKTVEKIGVFSSQTAQDIIAIVRETGLTGVQLHGGLDLSLAQRLNAEFGGRITILQTLHWRLDKGAGNADEVASQLNAAASEPAVHRILIDSQTKKASGGTGQSFDWSGAVRTLHVDGVPRHSRLIVAGGLDPHNVGEAVEKLKPWGVDVASGVEASPGRKDAGKMELFIRAVRNWEK